MNSFENRLLRNMRARAPAVPVKDASVGKRGEARYW
jgi:hypothetical protein